MAIDPTIALNPGRPAPLDMMTPTMNAYKTNQMGLDMEQTKANIAQTQAQTAGIEAGSQQKVRETAAQKWFGENADKFLVPSTSGGPAIYDAPAAMKAATKAGYADLVPHIAKDYSDFMTGQIRTAADAQGLNQIKFNASITAPSVSAQLVKAVPDKDKVKMYQASKQHIQSLFGDTISNDMMPDLTTPKEVDQWADATTSAASTYMDKLKMQIEQGLAGATIQGAATGVAAQSQSAAGQDVAASQASNASKILADGANIDPNMDTLGKRRAAVAAYNRINGTDFTIASPGMSAMLQQEAVRQAQLADTYSRAAAAGKPQTATPPGMVVAPGMQKSRDSDRLRLLEEEATANPHDLNLRKELEAERAKQGKTGATIETGPAKTVSVFNPFTGKVIQVAPEDEESVKRYFAKSRTPKAPLPIVGSPTANSIEERLGRGK